ncbi:AMP-binding protein, partial [Sulfitobacter sp.]|uniref:AMP-binding protein n=1 Tax=Sulfitobacter sp. TaxID=1903071 RepID=UPI003EF9823E
VLPLFVPVLRKVRRLRLGAKTGAEPDAPTAWPDDHPALMSFTSGSTGNPKAIMRSHGFLKAQNAAVAPLLESAEAEVDLVGFPVFVLANIALGITSVLPNWPLRNPAKADPRAIRAHCEKHGVTRLLLPPMFADVLADAPLPSSLGSVFTGGGPVFPDAAERLTAINPGLKVVAVYGSTEAEPIAECVLSDISDEDREAMANGAGLLAGHPASGVQVRIVDDEIQVAGGHVVAGYVDPADDAKTKVREADGTVWHRTGDGGRFDDKGRLWLRGRMAGRAGTLWPFEIEVAARSWPYVRQAALLPIDGIAVLAVEGDESAEAIWQTKARELGVDQVVRIAQMPLDKRHRSKVDYDALEHAVRGPV